MPLCYGGGVNSIEHVIKLVDMGVEKVANVESALQGQLDEQRNPTKAAGVPW